MGHEANIKTEGGKPALRVAGAPSLMARTGITFDQVARHADAMQAEGRNPTIQGLREALGGTGSPNTIHKHLTAWREARPQAVAQVPKIPAELVAALSRELSRAAAQACAEIEKKLVQAQADAARLAAEKAAAEGKAEQLNADLAGMREEVLRERLAAEQARNELAKAMLRFEEEMAALRTELTKERQGRFETEQQAAVLAARLADADKRGADLLDRLSLAKAGEK